MVFRGSHGMFCGSHGAFRVALVCSVGNHAVFFGSLRDGNRINTLYDIILCIIYYILVIILKQKQENGCYSGSHSDFKPLL